jgi:uncharacterized membrane protein
MGSHASIRLRDFRLGFALLAASWALALWLLSRLPARVPVHWNAAGEADRWGAPLVPVLLVPGVMLAMLGLFAALPRFDPRGAGYGAFRGAYLVLVQGILAFLLLVQGLAGAQMLGLPVNLGRVVPAAVGLLFAGLGLVLPRLGPNWFAGIRTPWTLEDDRVWVATHRVGGRLFVIVGVVVAAVAAMAPAGWGMAALVAGAVGAALGSVVYSYVAWRRLRPAS